MRHYLAFAFLLFGLAACEDTTHDVSGPVDPIGNFQLGHVGVVAPNLQPLFVTRDATKEEWIEAVTKELNERFDRFSGGKYYHLGVSVEGYSIPPPVVPGKSAVGLQVTLWDDAAQAKMNEETETIQIVRFFESRLTMTREMQIEFLAADAAREIEEWLREMQVEKGWFSEPVETGESDEAVETDAPEAEAEDANVSVTAAEAPETALAEPVTVPENVLSAIKSASVTTDLPL